MKKIILSTPMGIVAVASILLLNLSFIIILFVSEIGCKDTTIFSIIWHKYSFIFINTMLTQFTKLINKQ